MKCRWTWEETCLLRHGEIQFPEPKKNIWKKSKFQCDYCEFEAKSPKGLKTHEGHKHKDQVKPDITCEPLAPANPSMEIYKCALCEKYYYNLEEWSKLAYCHIAENLNSTDKTCQVCGHQFYDPKMLNKQNELHSWQCLSCGECLKLRKDKCCKEPSKGTEHRVLKWYGCHTNSNFF